MLTVTGVFDDGPAWRGGVRVGDRIRAIEGQRLREGKGLVDMAQALHGQRGGALHGERGGDGSEVRQQHEASVVKPQGERGQTVVKRLTSERGQTAGR